MTSAEAIPQSKQWLSRRRILNTSTSVLFILPAFTVFFVFFLYPVLSGVVYSFTDWNGTSRDFSFIGLRNYLDLLGDRRFVGSIGNTFYFAIAYTALQNTFGIVLAILVDRVRRGTNLYRAAIYLPAVISPLVVGFVWSFIYSPSYGINQLLGLGVDGPQWVGDPSLAMNSVILATLVQSVGMGMVLYLAGLQSIPTEIHEAAELDGASGMRKTFHITLPLLVPALTTGVVLTTIFALKVFEVVLVMTNGGPAGATDTMSLVMYDYAFGYGRFGYGTAIGVILSSIILGITVVQLRFFRRMEVSY